MKTKRLLISLVAVLTIGVLALALVACDPKAPAGENDAAAVGSNTHTIGYAVASAASMMSASGGSASAASAAADNSAYGEISGEINASSSFMLKKIAEQIEAIEDFIDRSSVVVKTEISDRTDFSHKLTISAVSALTGEADEYVLYYNTHLLADDDDDDDDIDLESESEYRLDGILFQGDKEFEISGEMEIESEGDENEQEFSMTASDSLGNMIRLEQEFSTETGEIEEELNYEVYILGFKVYSFSLEFETDEDGEELVVRSNTLGVDEIDELFGTEIRYSRGVNAAGNKCVKVDIMKSVAGVKLRAGLDVYYIAGAETGELTIGYTARGGADWNDLYEALFGAEEAPAEGTWTA